MTVVLEARLLDVHYGRVQALHGVSLEVRQGEIVCIIGANGAGKTTLLNAIVGLQPATAGHVDFQKRRLTGMPVESVVRLGVAYVPEGRQLFGSMSVRDNLILGSYSRYPALRSAGFGMWRQLLGGPEMGAELDRVYRSFPILKERQRQLAGSLSGGEQQMLAIARAMMSRPSLLLLDEPSVGLSPVKAKEVFRLVRRLRDDGLTIVLVEQNAGAALRLANRVYVLEGGRVALEGPAEELINDARVQSAYLGQGSQ